MQPGALQDDGKRILSTEPGGDGAGFPAANDLGHVHELQSRLLGKLRQRLRERLRGNVGGEGRGCDGLGQRRSGVKKRGGCADRKRA